MPQFLFVVEVPPSPAMSSQPAHAREWTQFENETNTILKTVKACTRLQLNAWLLPAENLLPVLVSMSAAAEKNHLAYSALLIEGVTDLSAKKSGAIQRIPLSGI